MNLFDKICKRTRVRGNGKVRYKVEVVGDTNDGDYATAYNEYEQNEFENRIILVLYLLKKYYANDMEQFVRIDGGDTHICLTPCHSDDYAHSLESISIERVNVDGTTTKMKLDTSFEMTEEEIFQKLNEYFQKTYSWA